MRITAMGRGLMLGIAAARVSQFMEYSIGAEAGGVLLGCFKSYERGRDDQLLSPAQLDAHWQHIDLYPLHYEVEADPTMERLSVSTRCAVIRQYEPGAWVLERLDSATLCSVGQFIYAPAVLPVPGRKRQSRKKVVLDEPAVLKGVGAARVLKDKDRIILGDVLLQVHLASPV